VIRFFMLSSHYRGPINYSLESLEQADAGLERLYLSLRGVEVPPRAPVTDATRRFVAAMDDDLNMPVAIAELQGLARAVNTAKDAGDAHAAGSAAAELIVLGARLGLLGQAPESFLKKAPKRVLHAEPGHYELAGQDASLAVDAPMTDAEIERLIDERAAARNVKNFHESDRIRDLLAARGVVLEDRPGGLRTLWRRGH
jgi:cysteinyl-tRNA synthetase